MNKSLRIALTKVIAVFLAIITVFACVVFAQSQDLVAPENPIIERVEASRMPLTEAISTEVDESIFDQKSDISEAANKEYEGNDLTVAELMRNDLDNPNDTVDTGLVGSNSGGTEIDPDNTSGSGSYTLPTNVNYFFADIVDVQSPYKPQDPRCYYKITHVYPELQVVKVVIINNDKPVTHWGETADNGWINLNSGENWIKVQVTYKLPNGEQKTFERETNPPMVKLYDPLDINFDDNNLESEYDNPEISFYVNPDPKEAYVEVYLGNRILAKDANGNYNATLSEGKNVITFKGRANGWNTTEVKKTVIYDKTRIIVYSPELEAYNYPTTKYEHLEKSITISTRVETAATGAPVSDARLDVSLNGKVIQSFKNGNNDNIKIDVPIGLNTIVISARGSNDSGNATAAVSTMYQLLVGQGGLTPEEVINGTEIRGNLNAEQITNNPIFSFDMSPVTIDAETGKTYPVTEHKQYVYHTYTEGGRTSTVRVLCRENVMGLYRYSLQWREGRNELEVSIVTDELYKLTYKYVVYYIPKDTSDDPIGRIHISVDASTIGVGGLVAGYEDIYEGESLFYPVQRLLQKHGYQTYTTGESNYSIYLSAIIKDGMLAGWDTSKISQSQLELITAAGGPEAWHGNYDINSLGENDFTSLGSGWIISMNGRRIAGLSNTFPKNGDECRLMFSLTGGSDVG